MFDIDARRIRSRVPQRPMKGEGRHKGLRGSRVREEV